MSNLLDVLYSNAWAITDGKLRDIEAMIQRHAAGDSLPEAKVEQIVADNERAEVDGLMSFDSAESGMYMRRDETAYVPLHGTIVSRAGFIARASGATSPQFFQKRLRAAAGDEDVSRIVLDIDSPGGTVAGTIPAADTVAEVAQNVEVVAVAENMIASAAYWIGSHADRLIVGKGAQVGSIGVIAVHRDHTGKLEEEGIESTIVRVQGDKALGHPEEEFSEEAREVWEERLAGYYNLFTKAVAESMSISETDLRDEIGSRSYMGRGAVEAGLADQIGSLAAVLKSSDNQKPKTQIAMSDSEDNSGEETVDERIEALRSDLEAANERAEKAEAQAEQATQLAEEQSEALASERKASLREEATSLVDDEIIGKGKAKQSQRDSLLSKCADEDGNYTSSRIDLLRTMYQGIAEGSAVPVDGAGIEGGTGRSEEGGSEASKGEYDIREDLLSSLPTRHRDKVEA